jgi:hypothetical protein
MKLAALLALVLGLAFSTAYGQDVDPSVKSARPLWSELSPKQQAILAPIAGEWENLDSARRKKWVAISNHYSRMSPQEQRRLQNRMQDWVSLSPAQRRLAREKYQSLRELPRPERGEIRQRWREYQRSEREKTPPLASDDTTK